MTTRDNTKIFSQKLERKTNMEERENGKIGDIINHRYSNIIQNIFQMQKQIQTLTIN